MDYLDYFPEGFDLYSVAVSSYKDAVAVAQSVATADHFVSEINGVFVFAHSGELSGNNEALEYLGVNTNTETSAA